MYIQRYVKIALNQNGVNNHVKSLDLKTKLISPLGIQLAFCITLIAFSTNCKLRKLICLSVDCP